VVYFVKIDCMDLFKKAFFTIEKHTLPLFLLSFFLIKIPPFYFLPPLRSAFLTTHTLARLIILALFASLAVQQIFFAKKVFDRKEKTLLTIFLVYFTFQSLSVLSAVDTTSFLQRYKDILFPGMFLFVSLGLSKSTRASRKFIGIFLIAAVFNFFYQMVMFWAPNLFQSLASTFVYQAHFELVNINLQRARLFIETYDEITIPFLFVFLTGQKKTWWRITIFGLFLMIIIPSLLSNFRSRILMLLFAFLASFIFLRGRDIFSRSTLLVSLFITGYLAVLVLNTIFGFSFVDRFALQHKLEDVKTIELRARNIERSVEMASGYPWVGVGLGNYFDHLSSTWKNSQSVSGWIRRETEIAATNPHDIFAQVVAETGIISLLYYVGMLGYFTRVDIQALFGKKIRPRKKAFIISFWALFLFSVFNPSTTLLYNSLFWVLRVMI
jgi:hypothetical protein